MTPCVRALARLRTAPVLIVTGQSLAARGLLPDGLLRLWGRRGKSSSWDGKCGTGPSSESDRGASAGGSHFLRLGRYPTHSCALDETQKSPSSFGSSLLRCFEVMAGVHSLGHSSRDCVRPDTGTALTRFSRWEALAWILRITRFPRERVLPFIYQSDRLLHRRSES